MASHTTHLSDILQLGSVYHEFILSSQISATLLLFGQTQMQHCLEVDYSAQLPFGQIQKQDCVGHFWENHFLELVSSSKCH